MLKNQILILTGGTISREFAADYLTGRCFDTVIAADSGLVTLDELKLPVHYIIGDFDSVPEELLDRYRQNGGGNPAVTIKKYNPVKDATDTHIAIELALELGAEEIVVLGATGTRIDHLLANIHLLVLPLQKNIKASIVDGHNKIYLINRNMTLCKKEMYGPFLSLLPLTETVTEVTLKGFKYPLTKRTLHIGESIGVSNEIAGAQADITLKDGILIAIESKD